MQLDPKTSALVVVDMQNDFCSSDGYYSKAGRNVAVLAAATGPVAALVAKAREANVQVIFTRLLHDHVRGPMEARHDLKPKRWTASGERLMPGEWGSDVVDALRPGAKDLVIDKTGYSSFHETALEDELRARGIKTLVLCGVVTYACVLATGFSAFDRGFDVVLAADAAGSWSVELGTATSQIVELLLGHCIEARDLNFTATAPAAISV